MLEDFVRQIKSGNYNNINSFLSELQIFLKETCKKLSINIKLKNFDINIDDIVQDILLKTIENDFFVVKNILDVDKTKSYFVSIVRNHIFSILKNNKKFENLDEYENQDNDTKKEEKLIFKGDHTDYLTAEEVIALFKEFLKSIKNKIHKEVFIMKLNGFSTKDIEKSTKLSEVNINTIYSRLKQNFVRFIDENNLYYIEDEVMREVFDWFFKNFNKEKKHFREEKIHKDDENDK